MPWMLVFCGAMAFQGAESNPAGSPRANPNSKPNIILILADDLGYGDLGCYGQTRIKTPNLDKLASEGIRFTDFYAGSTVCAPSRCALMTGLHAGHCTIRGNAKVSLRADDLTVAEILKKTGYHTGLVGKWGLGDAGSAGMPQQKGFDEFIGYLDQTHAHDYYTDHLDRYDPKHPEYKQSILSENQGGRKEKYIPDVFERAALSFVKINKPDQFNRFRPFFLYLATILPHANNEEGRRSGNGMQVPDDAPYSNEAWPQVEKNKAAMITRLDSTVGKLLAQLKELKIDEQTIIIFTSDNGPHKEGGADPSFFSSSGPFRGIKRDLYEGGIRVPLIVRWPGRIKEAQVSHLPCAFWDFLSTAADVAGADLPPRKIDGISFLPTLLGLPQSQRHEFLYWEFHERGFQQAIRVEDWKGVRLEAGGPLELYNLKEDAGEKTNIAVSNPAVIDRMEELLKNVRTDSTEFPIKPARKAGGQEK